MGHWLTMTVPYNPIIDALRYVCFAVGGGVMGRAMFMAATGRLRQWTRRARAAVGAWFCIGLFAILQEANQLHKPMLVWRLPLLLAVCVLALIAMFSGTEDDSIAPPKESRDTLHWSS